MTAGLARLTSEQEEASASDAYLVLWLVPLGAPHSADTQGEGAVKTASLTLAAFSSAAAGGCACTLGVLKATGFSCTVTCITCACARMQASGTDAVGVNKPCSC